MKRNYSQISNLPFQKKCNDLDRMCDDEIIQVFQFIDYSTVIKKLSTVSKKIRKLSFSSLVYLKICKSTFYIDGVFELMSWRLKSLIFEQVYYFNIK